MNEEYDEDFDEQWYNQKSSRMEEMLGPEHDVVMHALISYALGGALDLYYYPHPIDTPGTAVATKELAESPERGSSNRCFGVYELVMFTHHPLVLDDAMDESTDFGRIHRTINAVLNRLARYSETATLNPNETCEFPNEMEVVGGKCLIFDAYPGPEEEADFGLLLLMEIHREEMDYARERGGAQLLSKLKKAGYYPYSDIDRPTVNLDD